MKYHATDWMGLLDGWLGSDAYSTAWVGMVPDRDHLNRPAWPEVLDYLRRHQLDDGGWGEPRIYYAHERTISTLAAVKALHTWQADPDDAGRVREGLAALRRYAEDLANEAHEPIGFELLLPSLRDDLAPEFGAQLPLDRWTAIDTLNGEKLAAIRSAHPDPAAPEAWWFNLEMLPEEQLARLDDSVLDANGAVMTAAAATAAYLRARRLAGGDSPRAAAYLAKLVKQGRGSVPVCWPTEVFERVWALDAFRRAGLEPSDPALAPLVGSLHKSWELNRPGLSHSDVFPINDVDHTSVGFAALTWAGVTLSIEPVLAFRNGNYFQTFIGERGPSVSANLHALTALRAQPGFPHRDLAKRLTAWLRMHMEPDIPFVDKWHFSPYYPVGRAIHAFAGWDDEIAGRCVDAILGSQRPDGGWGWFRHSTLEETAYCVIGLSHALEQGLITGTAPLAQAAAFLQDNADQESLERLWIGKALYCPEELIRAIVFAAEFALMRRGIVHSLRSLRRRAA